MRALSSVAAGPVSWFIYEDIFCCWGCMEVVISDSGPETKDVTMYLSGKSTRSSMSEFLLTIQW